MNGVSAPFVVGAQALRDLGGLDVAGRPIVLPPRPHEVYVAFVIRAGSAAADVAYWNSVSAQLVRMKGQWRVRLAAFCDDAACSSRTGRQATFPVIAYAEVVVLRQAQKLNNIGATLEMDYRGRTLKVFPWRGVPAARTASLLEQLPK